MSSVMSLIKMFILAMVLIPLVWLASCAMLGVGAVVAVKEVAESETVRKFGDKVEEEVEERELAEHNERINREASYSSSYDDYGEPM